MTGCHYTTIHHPLQSGTLKPPSFLHLSYFNPSTHPTYPQFITTLLEYLWCKKLGYPGQGSDQKAEQDDEYGAVDGDLASVGHAFHLDELFLEQYD